VTLNDLEYDWPQAFGRFSWEVRNPDMGELTTDIRRISRWSPVSRSCFVFVSNL